MRISKQHVLMYAMFICMLCYFCSRTHTLLAFNQKGDKQHEQARHVQQEQPHQLVLQGCTRMVLLKVSGCSKEEWKDAVPPQDDKLDLCSVWDEHRTQCGITIHLYT